MILKLIVLYFSILLFVSIRCLEKVINLSNEISGENYSSKSDPHFFFLPSEFKSESDTLDARNKIRTNKSMSLIDHLEKVWFREWKGP